ncbi:MAG: 23S rRNA (uracil(1939)-C(5))-methyltransferase RlmD [Bacteroidales bacterium]|nr:23S rRNA (uracil(1939)-C(5))-methyltransferase RlmD [Candidatus Cacconaster merdequi]
MGRKKKPSLEGIEIEAVAAEGNGLAHIDGQVLFVRQAVPGDIVDVQVNKVRRGYMSGYVTRLVKPSDKRVEPFCPHYGVCGGCAWQILPYRMQLDFKQQQVIDQLTRIGHLTLPEVSPILGSEKIEYYRNKLEYTFSNRRWVLSDEEEENLDDVSRCGLGFHIGGHFDKVLDIRDCHLQKEPTNAIRLFIKDYALDNGLSFYNLRENKGFMRNLMVRTTSTGEVMLVVCFGNEAVGNNGSEAGIKRNALLQAVSDRFPEITSLYYVVNPKCNDTFGDLECVLFSGREAVYEKMESLRFKIGPKSFYQTNSQQAYRLYSVVRECVMEGIGCLALSRKPVIYDLYTGTGTIALFLSSLAEKVVGIEYVPEAIEDAKINAAVNGISNAEFIAGDMKDVLSEDFIAGHGTPDIVILDPPRAGIHPDVAEVLMKTAPQRMVYVSCNPATQARDLAIFASAYDIVRVQPVDMFPHTTHVENVVSLVKR